MTTNKRETSHDKHWLRHMYGNTVESHTQFLLHGHKRVFSQHPSKRSLQNHIVRLSRLIDELRTEQGALQSECAQLRTAIRRLCNIYVVDDYYMGQLREERLEAAVNRAIDQALAKHGDTQ